MSRPVRVVQVGDFLTDALLTKAMEIGPNVDRLEAEITKPNMAEINRKLGQENDSRYLAYVLVYALERAAGAR